MTNCTSKDVKYPVFKSGSSEYGRQLLLQEVKFKSLIVEHMKVLLRSLDACERCLNRTDKKLCSPTNFDRKDIIRNAMR